MAEIVSSTLHTIEEATKTAQETVTNGVEIAQETVVGGIEAVAAKTLPADANQDMHDLMSGHQNIDRRTCKRVVPMKVIIAGLGRTGTSCE